MSGAGSSPWDDDPAAYEELVLVDLLDRLLDRGVVIAGDITLSVADVDLVYLGLRVLLSSASTAERVGAPVPSDAALRRSSLSASGLGKDALGADALGSDALDADALDSDALDSDALDSDALDADAVDDDRGSERRRRLQDALDSDLGFPHHRDRR